MSTEFLSFCPVRPGQSVLPFTLSVCPAAGRCKMGKDERSMAWTIGVGQKIGRAHV